LRAEIEKLKALQKKLEAQINPPPRPEWKHNPPDHTAGMSMSRSAMEAMIAVDDPAGRMADLRAFQQKLQSVTSPEPQRQRGSGWADERPLEPPGGQSTIAHCDRLVDEQDRLDKIALAEKLAAAEIATREAGKKEAGNG
jgi:hypothetical protein